MFRSRKSMEEAKRAKECLSHSQVETTQLPNLVPSVVLNPPLTSSDTSCMQPPGFVPNHLHMANASTQFQSLIQHISSVPNGSYIPSNAFFASLGNMPPPYFPQLPHSHQLQPTTIYRDQSSSPSCESQPHPSLTCPSSQEQASHQPPLEVTQSEDSEGDSEDDIEEDLEDDTSEETQNARGFDGVEIIDKDGKIDTRPRMTVKDVMKLSGGRKVVIEVNEHGQPIKGGRRVLTRWMTEHVTQPNICPPDAKDFKEIRKLFGIPLLAMVREKFLLPKHDNLDDVLMLMFGNKYRNNRHKTIKKLFQDAENSLKDKLAKNLKDNGHADIHVEEIIKTHKFSPNDLEKELDNLPCLPGYSNQQWVKFLDYIKSDVYKNFSNKGKKARANQFHIHTTGTKSFAQVENELVSKKKRKLGYVEFFDQTHKRKSGGYVTKKSKEFMKKAKKKIQQYKSNAQSDDQIEVEKKAWDDLMGEDRPGRARGFGVGVTKSKVSGFRVDLMKLHREESTDDYTKKQLKLLHNMMVDQTKAMDQHANNTSLMIARLQAENDLYRATCGALGINPMATANDNGYPFGHVLPNGQGISSSASGHGRHTSSSEEHPSGV